MKKKQESLDHLDIPSTNKKQGQYYGDKERFSTAKRIIVDDLSERPGDVSSNPIDVSSNPINTNAPVSPVSAISSASPSPMSGMGKLGNNIRRRSKQFWGSQEIELGGIDADRGGGHIALDRTSHASIQELPENALDDEQFEKQMCFGACCHILRVIVMYVAAFMTFFIFTLDILYALKAPFTEDYLKHTLGLLAFRYGLIFLFGLYWYVQNNAGRNAPGNRASPDDKKDVTRAILHPFQNLRGMPIFIAFGFYKILPNKDFRCEIFLGYVIEVITSVIPMLSVQWNNNASTPGSLTWLQVTALTFRIISVLFFLVEIVIFGWESLINYKMRDTNIKRYRRLTDKKRIEEYGPSHSKISLIAIILTSAMLLLGGFLLPGRECLPAGDGQQPTILHWGACISCPKNCQTCTSSDKCQSCSEGYYLSEDSMQCVDCDSDSKSTLCRVCAAPDANSGLTPQCQACVSHLHLDPETHSCKTCEQITGVTKCSECDIDSRICTACDHGYYLPEDGDGNKGRECVRCHDQFEFCGECIQGRCWKCMESVAKFDRRDRCTVCQDPWTQMRGEWGTCYCPAIAVINDTFKCQECQQLVPNCLSCQYSATKESWELGAWVGWDDKISAHGVQFVSTNRAERPEYITCKEGDGLSAVDVTINQTRDAVLECDTLIDGCYQCSASKKRTSVSCQSCNYGYHLTKSKSPKINEAFGIYVEDTCTKCSTSYSSHCLDCNQDTCTLCEPTYQLDPQYGDCSKCQYEFMCENMQN